jgi:hypothetical protein
VLRISARTKRPVSMGPSSVAAKKQAKVSKLASSTPGPGNRPTAPTQPTDDSSDDRVVACPMLDVAYVASSLSSLSSESSASESILSSLPPIPDLVIQSELLDNLKWEKTEAVAVRETEIMTIHMKFQDYRVRHRRKLHDFRVNLEKAVNEFGVKCLSYPGKNSTIGEVVEWFDEEIKALPATIAKANKNFICYCVAWVIL